MLELSSRQRKPWILVTIALIFVGWVLWSTRGALVPFAIGGVIAYLLAAGMYLIPPLAAQTVAFAESIPSYQEDVRREAAGLVAEYERLSRRPTERRSKRISARSAHS